ncbi:hypothetical protein BS47DRAFT_455579 [Hydnum rufescens UP504]|uniref:Uncharacterized protein n=1 Tax=Hydnum rufescens UP504 TaxID=1448309 RepID=A0A9P6DKH7_9AGAM|nr:hypothetical protein BS47DRAFT_455579 [Hydnum rufescens UP504]
MVYRRPRRTPIDRVNHAKHPCGKDRRCGHSCGDDCVAHHSCSGRCMGWCRHKCVHVPCSKACSEACPPCLRPCAWKCKHVLAFLATNDVRKFWPVGTSVLPFVVKIVEFKSAPPAHLRTARMKSAISACRRHANSPRDRIGVLISDPSPATTVSIAPSADPAAVHPGGSSPMFTIT